MTSPDPYFSEASAITFCSSADILPFLVIILTLNTSGYLLSCKQPKPFTLFTSSGGIAPSNLTFTSFRLTPPSKLLVDVKPIAFILFCTRYDFLPLAQTSKSFASFGVSLKISSSLSKEANLAPGIVGVLFTSITVYPFAFPIMYSYGVKLSNTPKILFSRTKEATCNGLRAVENGGA